MTGTYCPNCKEQADEGTYPPNYEGHWWCSDCLRALVKYVNLHGRTEHRDS